MNLTPEQFIEVCYQADFSIPDIQDRMLILNPDTQQAKPSRIRQRISSLRERGLLPLDSGNQVSTGEQLKATSTLYDSEGNIKLQWVKTDVDKQVQLSAISEAITDLVESLPQLPLITSPTIQLNNDTATIYISNDLHLGALMWDKESGTDWNLDIATTTIKSSYDYLFDCSPNSRVGIVCDLGDLTEVDDYKNMTPHSGNILSVDSRYPKILRAAYESLIYGINKALQKHELVYFYNISGNHDIVTGDAVREVIRMVFKDNPRVIVNEEPRPIKYHQHGKTLIQFAHGDGLKMTNAGETMAFDCQDIFSSTTHRYAHFGHTHKNSVVESRLCTAESHRNLAPLNHWAYHKGFRGPLGSMKSITYHSDFGEISRSIFNISMLD